MWWSVFLLFFATQQFSTAFEVSSVSTLKITIHFQIFWNVPSVQCKKVRPDLYNITANENRRFWGEKFGNYLKARFFIKVFDFSDILRTGHRTLPLV
jgi:hypothetical protein